MRVHLVRSLASVVLSLLIVLPQEVAAESIGVPEKGLDRLETVDGRIFQGGVGTPTPEGIPFKVASGEVLVPTDLVRRVRLFRDFDSTARTPEEEAQVAKGLVKWDGRWMASSEATAHREREIAEVESRALATKRIEVGTELAPAGEEDEFTFWSELTKEETATCRRFAGVVRQHLMGVVKVPPRILAAARGTKINVYFVRSRKHAPSIKSFAPRQRQVVIEIPKELPKGAGPEGGEQLVSELLDLWGDVNFPGWLNYGLRGYYRSARLENGKLRVGDAPGEQWLLLDELSASKSPPFLTSVLRPGGGRLSAEFFADEREVHLTWEVVHFLLHGQRQKYRTRFTGWITRLWPEGEARDRPPYDPGPAFAELREGILKGLDDAALERAVREHAMALEVDDPGVRLARALARLDRGDRAGAAADLAKLVAAGGDAPVSANAVRTFLRMPGSSAQASAILDRLIAADPFRWELRLERARLAEPEKGAVELRLASDLAGANLKDQRPMLREQWCKVPLIEPVRASSDEERARVEATITHLPLLLDDTMPRAEFHRESALAGLLTLLGRYKEARDLASGILAREKFSPSATQSLAVALAGLGDVKECLAVLRGIEFRSPFLMEEDIVRPARTILAMDNGKGALALMDAALAQERMFMNHDIWILWVRAAVAAGDLKRANAIVQKGSAAMPPGEAWRLRELLP